MLAVSLRATVRQITSPSDKCQVYSYNSSLSLQPLHSVAATHQISRANVAFKQHIKAAMLIGGGALYTALFVAAEQVASNPNDRHEGV